MATKSLRSQPYRGARELGNLQAARKGPASYAKRIVRRKVYRSTNRVTATSCGDWGSRVGLPMRTNPRTRGARGPVR
jgi:hypothetical protein